MPKAFLRLSIVLSCLLVKANAQDYARIKGQLLDQDSLPFKEANIRVVGTTYGTNSDDNGSFELKLPPGREFVLEITHVELGNPVYEQLPVQEAGATYSFTVIMIRGVRLKVIEFEDERENKGGTFKEFDPEKIETPNPSGDITTYLKTLPGVNSNNELSTQYSVRGGNYDENLVYINGIEIYRPFLIRSGQSEGLSIVNPDMVKTLSFSAGGFDAYYGDKLSSVLDIIYKQPDSFAFELSGSLLGGRAHLENASKNGKFSYMASGRYRTNRYLLNSLDVQGEYNPVFKDMQSYMSYKWDKMSLSWLSYFGGNSYQTRPQSQSTKFGTVRDALQIDVFYEGQEITAYNTFLNAISLDLIPNDSTELMFAASVYTADESERFDVLGQYWLSELDNEIGSETFGEPKFTLGAGSYLIHGRNYLKATILSLQHRGVHFFKNHSLSWGGRYQHDIIDDELKEWRYLDSAGYSVPRGEDDIITIPELVQSEIDLQTNRFSAYIQDRMLLNEDLNVRLNLGVRANYWDYNGQLLIAPRINFSFEPNRRYNRQALASGFSRDRLRKNIRIKAAAGLYQQPPFYRELRTKDGRLVEGVKAQQSIHALAGAEWNFELWQRDQPFKFSGDLYYKYLWDLIPYEIENVRIRYLPEYTATGHVYGADFQVAGEFIPDLPSWFSFSLMRATEDIDGDVFINQEGEEEEVGPVVRPTDQRYAFNILFQDFLKDNETYQVHLNLVFAHGLPFGPPGLPQYRNVLRIPPYRRADIGFSKVLFDQSIHPTPSKWINKCNRITVSAQVFNLFGIRNTISYLWVKDIFNQQYAVPNYLTSRRFNLELRVRL